MVNNILSWLKRNLNNIFKYTWITLFVVIEDKFFRGLLIAVIIIVGIYHFIDFHKEFNRNMKRLESDPHLNYPYDLKKDGRFIYFSRTSIFIFMLSLMIILYFVKHYLWVYFIIFILIFIIAYNLEKRFEKRTNLRELLFGKDEIT